MDDLIEFPLTIEALTADELISMYMSNAELIIQEMEPNLAILAFVTLIKTKRIFEVDETG